MIKISRLPYAMQENYIYYFHRFIFPLLQSPSCKISHKDKGMGKKKEKLHNRRTKKLFEAISTSLGIKLVWMVNVWPAI